jgi:hypothetical protein
VGKNGIDGVFFAFTFENSRQDVYPHEFTLACLAKKGIHVNVRIAVVTSDGSPIGTIAWQKRNIETHGSDEFRDCRVAFEF